MDWRNIPSLSALRAFEATARLKNQSAAARELNVTHAAINQHIRTLETFFDLSLFQRDGRELELTPKGNTLFQSVSTGFSEIEYGVKETAKTSADNRVKIAITPSLYQLWMLPRIEDFWRKHPNVHLEISASPELVDLKKDDFDLAIRYGKGNWPPYQSELLKVGEYGIYCSKAYLGKYPYLRVDIASASWIRANDSPEFFEIHEQFGVDFDDQRHRAFEHNSEARAAMVAGLGLICQDNEFLEFELKFGLVVKVAEVDLPDDIGYYLVRKSGVMSSGLECFVKWLKGQVAKDEAR